MSFMTRLLIHVTIKRHCNLNPFIEITAVSFTDLLFDLLVIHAGYDSYIVSPGDFPLSSD